MMTETVQDRHLMVSQHSVLALQDLLGWTEKKRQQWELKNKLAEVLNSRSTPSATCHDQKTASQRHVVSEHVTDKFLLCWALSKSAIMLKIVRCPAFNKIDMTACTNDMCWFLVLYRSQCHAHWRNAPRHHVTRISPPFTVGCCKNNAQEHRSIGRKFSKKRVPREFFECFGFLVAKERFLPLAADDLSLKPHYIGHLAYHYAR